MFRCLKHDFRKRKLALLTLVTFICWFCWSRNEPLQHETHAVIHSAYYFSESESLGKNAVAIVMTIDRNYARRYQKLQLIGKNSAGSLVSGVKVSIESDGRDDDFVTALIQSDGDMGKLDKLEIKSKDTVFEIPFQRASSSPAHSVVFCYSPQKISENWQNFLLQTRISRHFGAHSHYYVRRITEPFSSLIRELHDDFLSVQPWVASEKSTNGAVFTDCLLQYKERTEYVAFLEPDDLMIPSGADSFYEEFLRLFRAHPMVTSLKYAQYQMTIGYTNSWSNFSISGAIRSSEQRKLLGKPGKLLVRTAMFNSTGAVFSENANTWENSSVKYRLNTQKVGEKLPERRFVYGFRKLKRFHPDGLITAESVIRSINGSINFDFAIEPPSLVSATH